VKWKKNKTHRRYRKRMLGFRQSSNKGSIAQTPFTNRYLGLSTNSKERKGENRAEKRNFNPLQPKVGISKKEREEWT
jgi:hypothetical protein